MFTVSLSTASLSHCPLPHCPTVPRLDLDSDKLVVKAESQGCVFKVDLGAVKLSPPPGNHDPVLEQASHATVTQQLFSTGSEHPAHFYDANLLTTRSSTKPKSIECLTCTSSASLVAMHVNINVNVNVNVAFHQVINFLLSLKSLKDAISSSIDGIACTELVSSRGWESPTKKKKRE